MSIITKKTCKSCETRSFFEEGVAVCPGCGADPDKAKAQPKAKAKAKKKETPELEKAMGNE